MEKKGTPGLTGDRAGQEGLAPSRGGPTSSTPLGYAGAEAEEAFRVLEELHDLLELLLGLVGPGDVGEAHAGLVADLHARAASSEAEGLIRVALGLPHDEEEHGPEEYERQEVEQDGEEAADSARSLHDDGRVRSVRVDSPRR